MARSLAVASPSAAAREVGADRPQAKLDGESGTTGQSGRQGVRASLGSTGQEARRTERSELRSDGKLKRAPQKQAARGRQATGCWFQEAN